MPESATILCVDDEKVALFLRKAVLQKFGFEVVTANSAKEALQVLTTQQVDLVLSDLLMPEVSGTELAKAIKEHYPNLPVVVVSGVNEIPPDVRFADLFISKLEGPVRMCERLREVLGQSRSASSAS